MLTAVVAQAKAQLPHPFNLNPFMTRQLELLLLAFNLGALEHNEVTRRFGDLSMTKEGLFGTPFNALWEPQERRTWLAQSARWPLFHDWRSVKLRLAIQECAFLGLTREAAMVERLNRKGVDRDDILLLKVFMQDTALWPKFLANLSPLWADKDVAADITFDFETIRTQLHADMVKYKMHVAAARETGKRLSFAAKHEGMDYKEGLHDFASEVTARGISYYYRARPLKTRLHAVNIMRTAIQGGVQHIIVRVTNPDFARLIQTEQGWSRTVVSFTEVPEEVIDRPSDYVLDPEQALLRAEEEAA